MTPHAEAAHTEVAREFKVGVAVTDHGAGSKIDRLVAHEAFDQFDLRLAAVAAVALAVWTDDTASKLDALRTEGVEHELVRHVEGRLREARAAEAVLVRDHGELVAGSLRLAHARRTRRHEADLLERIHLLVGRLLDQRAVAVDEKYLGRSSEAPDESVVLFGRAHGDAQTVRRHAAHVADQQLRTRAAERSLRVVEIHQQEIGHAGPDLAHPRRWREPARRRSRSARTCATRSRWMASCGAASVATPPRW
jgi:hypothetical protein